MGVMELRPGTGTRLPPNPLRGKAEPRNRLGLPKACNKLPRPQPHPKPQPDLGQILKPGKRLWEMKERDGELS